MKTQLRKNRLLWIAAFLVLVVGACRKSAIDKQAEVYKTEKDWIHQNGGAYKNETMAFRTQEGTIRKGSLDWSSAKKFEVNGVSYTEIPFSFDNAPGPVFSFVLRVIDNRTEAAIKVTQLNATLQGKEGVKIGTLETYNNLNGARMDTWFRESSTGRLMRGSGELKRADVTMTSASYLSKPKTNLAQIECDVYVFDVYGYHCWGNPIGNDYNVTCGYVYEGSFALVFCYDTGGGGSNPPPSNPWPPSGGGSTPTPTQPPTNKPCPGDVIKDPTIAKSNATNTNGGRMGYTRRYPNGTPKYHGGLDIYAQPNTPLYAVYGGVVEKVVSIYPPDYYGSPKSFGNQVVIRSTLPDGSVIRTLYGHMNSSPLNQGDPIQAGDPIGLSGRTGNAQNVPNPHVHVQMTKNGVAENPENHLATKFNSAGASTGRPCN